MASKFWQKYERVFLLALVIILVATFSITGALAGCFDRSAVSQYELGGTFDVSPTNPETLSDSEFDTEFRELTDFKRALPIPSLQFRQYMGAVRADPFVGAWNHIIVRDAAREAGYRVGPYEAKATAREVVQLATQQPVNDVTYRDFLQRRYPGGNPAEFLNGMKDLVLKDMFITPIVDTARYPVTYEQSYDKWKLDRERVDLEYVVLPAASFKEVVEPEERTRVQIADVEKDLTKLTRTLNQIRTTMANLESLKGSDPDGAWPASLDVLIEKRNLSRVPVDSWGEELRYTVGNDSPDLRSAGADGEFDNDDDITFEMQRQITTQGNLRDTARAILQWRGGANAWPTSTADLLKPAKEGALAPLQRLLTDGFDRAFEFESAADAGAATLTALGPDGESGTADDLTVSLEAEMAPGDVHVPLGAAFRKLLGKMPEDAYGKAITVHLDGASPILWRVASFGLDGVEGTEDDLEGGNGQQLRDFYAQPSVKPKYRLPARRKFEALFVHLPLLSAEVVAKIWEAFPEQRPTSEDRLYQSWREYRGDQLLYSAEDPADPETGHGAEVLARIAPDATRTLVPSKSIFPADLDAAAKLADGDETEEEGDDEGDDATPETPDPLKEEYTTKGWREILIRQRFVEHVMAELLSRAVESERAIEAWEAEWGDQEGEDGDPIPSRPARVSFESLLAETLNPFLVGAAEADKGGQTFRYFVTEKPEGASDGDEWGLTREEWEAHPEIGDTNLTVFLGSRSDTPGGYVGSTVQLAGRVTKAIVRNMGYHPSRDPELEEVFDDVFQEYVAKRQLDKAVSELKRLKEEAPVPSADESVADVEPQWKAALEKWGETHGRPYSIERTGLFVGGIPPLSVEIDDEDESKKAAYERRRNFIWRMGYDSVRPTESRQDTTTGEPGSFGRTPIADGKLSKEGGTASAYLVRVAAREFPTRHEFSPREYAEYLMEAAFGVGGGASRLKDLPGAIYKSLSHFIADEDFLERKWMLKTNTPLLSLDR